MKSGAVHSIPRFIFIAFIVVSVVNIMSPALGLNGAWSKPLIVPLLLWYYAACTPVRVAFLMALILCWLGDVALIFPGGTAFIVGLGCFLLGHVLYIISFARVLVHFPTTGMHPVFKWLAWGSVVTLAVIIGAYVLPDVTGALKAPVVVYTLVIATMFGVAAMRYGKTSTSSFWLVLSGTFLFLTSDTLLAIDKFSVALPAAHVLIMTTYVLAQALLVMGAIRHASVPNQ